MYFNPITLHESSEKLTPDYYEVTANDTKDTAIQKYIEESLSKILAGNKLGTIYLKNGSIIFIAGTGYETKMYSSEIDRELMDILFRPFNATSIPFHESLTNNVCSIINSKLFHSISFNWIVMHRYSTEINGTSIFAFEILNRDNLSEVTIGGDLKSAAGRGDKPGEIYYIDINSLYDISKEEERKILKLNMENFISVLRLNQHQYDSQMRLLKLKEEFLSKLYNGLNDEEKLLYSLKDMEGN